MPLNWESERNLENTMQDVIFSFSIFHAWPYKQVHTTDSVVIDNIQGQINNIARAYAAQREVPESMPESENTSDNDMAEAQMDNSLNELTDSGSD